MRAIRALEPIRLPEGEPCGPVYVYNGRGRLLRVIQMKALRNGAMRIRCARHGLVGCRAPNCVERERWIRRRRTR